MDSLSVVLLGLVVAGIAYWMHRPGSNPGPRLTDDLAPEVLARAGFPVTRHNVLALREELGAAFLAEARALGAPGDEATWDRVTATCDRLRLGAEVGVDLAEWPQRVVDEIAAVDARIAVTVAHRCPRALLDAVGSGHGVLGGSVFAPLPRVPAPPLPVALPVPRGSLDDLLPSVRVTRPRAMA